MNATNNATVPVVDWVKCPVCGESDMRREQSHEGVSLIFCVNHSCKSNGGSNMVALEETNHKMTVQPADHFRNSALLAVTVSDLLVEAQNEVERIEEELKGLEGAAYFLKSGELSEASNFRASLIRRLKKVTDHMRPTAMG